jgi:hypothetical protein
MLLRLTTIALTLTGLLAGDTLTLRSGRVVTGQYVGGDSRHIQMAIGDRVDTFNIEDIGDLQFGGNAPPAPPPPSSPSQTSQGFAPQPPPPVPVAGVQIPTGTAITVRMIEKIDSGDARLGQTFRASVDEPVLVNGQTVIPRGADALVKLVEDQQSGKFEGKTVLTLALTDITINGQMIDTTTGNVSQASSSRGARTAKVVGGATVLGAILGALAGGGRGAAIGAASGAAVGGGAEVLTKGQQVKIPSETRLNFTLQQPIQF